MAQANPRIYRVGLLTPGQVAIVAENGEYGAPLIRGLVARGYAPGKNLLFERRGAQMKLDLLPGLVDELVASKVDVIVTVGYPAALAAKQRSTIPVVVFSAGDPIGTGLVSNLARPGGNLTGISDVSAELTPKRLDLLRQMTPALRRVAMLWNINDLSMTLRYEASEAGARAIGIGVQPLPLRVAADFDEAFASMTREKPDAVLLVSDSLTHANRKRIFEYAASHRLPVIYEVDWVVRDGGLISYGPDVSESLDRVASLVDRILKGAKPGELPFEQPRRFRLTINLKAAKALGLAVPSVLVTGADEVIE